jgi:hypothetical protein
LITFLGTAVQAGDLRAGSRPYAAQSHGDLSIANRAAGSPESAAGRNARTSDPKQTPRTDHQTQRVRELIYFFRNYRVFSRDEEWARTIRELAKIGKMAVPELVAELDRTDRDATLRSLAFCLRAIGDPRAVPALIRAIPKALRPPGSDCGLGILDPELRAFMLAHQNYKDDQATHVACGRPVNEILSAIERITQHQEPPNLGKNDPLRGVFLGGSPEQQARQRALFEQRRQLWQAWWAKNGQGLVTQEELRSVELPRRAEDLVESAGVARYGMLFPTGRDVRLGPVRMLRLTTSAYWNGKSHLDFDTGRVFEEYERYKSADWGRPDEFGARISTWYRHNAIDVRCQGPPDGVDLQLWLIDDRRWDTLPAEIQKNEPLPLGREATSYLARFETSRTDFKYDQLATFLFTTREGGRGIVQVFPKDLDADRYRVRYRMWLTAPTNPTAQPPRDERVNEPPRAKPSGRAFGKTITAALDLPAEGRACLMDLETGRKAIPPKILRPDEFTNAASLPRNAAFAKWCRDRGIDVVAHVAAVEHGAAAPAGAGAAGLQFQTTLIGLDMIEARIVPQTFDELTVEAAREIIERVPAHEYRTAWMGIDAQLAERPDTFAFKTREGTVGLLQLEAPGTQSGKLTIRYRLEPRN